MISNFLLKLFLRKFRETDFLNSYQYTKLKLLLRYKNIRVDCDRHTAPNTKKYASLITEFLVYQY